ncbi:MAG: DUF998 domain-containing protein [Clostridia bacterium]|nr:DUF998 domain-containing protein [Clostridia bacterium]
MKNNMIIRKMGIWACVCGILSVVFYLLHDIIGAVNYPGYQWTKQAVSDLTALDAPSFPVARALSGIHGIFTGICCAFLCVMLSNARKSLKAGIFLFTAMHGISAIGYSLFPLSGSGYDGSVQSFIHVYVVTILVVLLSIVSLILIAAGSFRDHRKALGFLSLAALVCMFFGAAGNAILPKEIFGIVERFSTYSAVVFTGILGIYWCREVWRSEK